MRSRGPLIAAGAAAAIAALVVALSSGSGGAPPAPTTTSSTTPAVARAADFGTDVGQIFQTRTYDTAQVNRELSSAAAAGLGLARVAALWEFTEPQAPSGAVHRYDWRYDDYIASRLEAFGFKWVVVVAFAPAWAAASPNTLHSAPLSVADYAAYAAALAARYRGLIAAYEIWNEENSSEFWRPAPNAAAYAQLYLAARAAIHRADSNTPVIVGGLDNSNPGFLSALLREPGMQGQVDGVAIHPYGHDPGEVLSRVRAYRRQLRALGAGTTPLYVTEYGWSTSAAATRTYATAANRGPFIATTAEQLLRSDCNVRAAIFYAWITAQQYPGSVDQWYGVASPAGGPTPGTRAVATVAPALASAGGAAPVAVCGG